MGRAHDFPVFAPVCRYERPFGAGWSPSPNEGFQGRFAPFRRRLRGQQGSRRSPAKRVRWEEAELRNERFSALLGGNEGYGASDDKQSAMDLSRGKLTFCVNSGVSEKGRSEPGLCGGHLEYVVGLSSIRQNRLVRLAVPENSEDHSCHLPADMANHIHVRAIFFSSTIC